MNFGRCSLVMSSAEPHIRSPKRRLNLGRLLAAAAIPFVSSANAEPRSVAAADTSAAGEFTFAVIGDIPYSTLDVPLFYSVLAAIDPSCEFILHLGDFKASTDSCDDNNLNKRIAMLDSAQQPLIYVPGDNDWSDCIKPSAGGFRPFDRLEFLRSRAFAHNRSLGRNPLRLRHQQASSGHGAVPENLRWRHGAALFVTLNRPGGIDLRKFSNEESVLISELYRANEIWLRQAFDDARQAGIRQLVIAAHVNPKFENDHGGWRLPSRRDEQASFRRLLADLTERFDGQVLFIHGDTHWFQVNQPLRNRAGEEVPNFTRLECYGTPFSSSWVQVRVGTRSAPAFVISTHHVDPTRRP